MSFGFPLLEVPMGTIVDELAFYVGANPHSDFDLNDTDLVLVEAVDVNRGDAADRPQKRILHIRNLPFSSMTKLINSKHPILPMCKFELIMGPRTISTKDIGGDEPMTHASTIKCHSTAESSQSCTAQTQCTIAQWHH